ncbi:hypothetical protein REMIM1_PC00152 (plasmid) [Rhizobium etli bv. mimosae str. Mim1]|nr:hypothetical protein REMIM1_PC00152 [Rhizobium etli bv. mimosae str. Mim1]
MFYGYFLAQRPNSRSRALKHMRWMAFVPSEDNKKLRKIPAVLPTLRWNPALLAAVLLKPGSGYHL